MSMTMNSPNPMINTKLIILSIILIFIVYISINKKAQYYSIPIQTISSYSNSLFSSCNKIPLSLSESIVHYATSKITPQQTIKEISVTMRVLESKSPCNFLVYGIGFDSKMWASLNHGGRTVFLEGSMDWVQFIKKETPSLEVYFVEYDTNVSQAKKLLDVGKSKACQVVGDSRLSECPLVLRGLPSVIYETEWDLIMIDAPAGYKDDSPGRMKAIYTAGLWAKNRRDGQTHVFVHDVNRQAENLFSKAFLCESYLKETEGLLRHFEIPSHRNGDRPFCP